MADLFPSRRCPLLTGCSWFNKYRDLWAHEPGDESMRLIGESMRTITVRRFRIELHCIPFPRGHVPASCAADYLDWGDILCREAEQEREQPLKRDWLLFTAMQEFASAIALEPLCHEAYLSWAHALDDVALAKHGP